MGWVEKKRGLVVVLDFVYILAIITLNFVFYKLSCQRVSCYVFMAIGVFAFKRVIFIYGDLYKTNVGDAYMKYTFRNMLLKHIAGMTILFGVLSLMRISKEQMFTLECLLLIIPAVVVLAIVALSVYENSSGVKSVVFNDWCLKEYNKDFALLVGSGNGRHYELKISKIDAYALNSVRKPISVSFYTKTERLKYIDVNDD